MIVQTISGGNIPVAKITAAEKAKLALLNPENLLVNSGFIENPAGYVSGAVLASGARGHAMFKAGANGGDYTFTQNSDFPIQITIASGKSLITAIEDINFPNAENITISWEGTAQARAKNGYTPDLSSESFVNSPLVVSKTANTGLSIEFDAGTLSEIMVNRGSTPQPYSPYSKEKSERYIQKILASARFPAAATGQFHDTTISFIDMRTSPAITLIDAGVTALLLSVNLYAMGQQSGRFSIEASAAGDCYSIDTQYLLTAELI